jgi:hypothetical protein
MPKKLGVEQPFFRGMKAAAAAFVCFALRAHACSAPAQASLAVNKMKLIHVALNVFLISFFGVELSKIKRRIKNRDTMSNLPKDTSLI